MFRLICSNDIFHDGQLLDKFLTKLLVSFCTPRFSWDDGQIFLSVFDKAFLPVFQFLHPALFPSHHLKAFHLLDAMQIKICVFGFLWIWGNFRQHRKSLLQRMLHDYILPFSPKSNIRQKQFQVFIDICPFIHSFSSSIFNHSIEFPCWLIDIFQKEADDLWCEGINLRTGQQVCFSHGALDIPRIKKCRRKKLSTYKYRIFSLTLDLDFTLKTLRPIIENFEINL